MVIQVEIPEPESVEVKPEDIPLDVLYEDHDIIIVNKDINSVQDLKGKSFCHPS